MGIVQILLHSKRNKRLDSAGRSDLRFGLLSFDLTDSTLKKLVRQRMSVLLDPPLVVLTLHYRCSNICLDTKTTCSLWLPPTRKNADSQKKVE